MFFRHASFKTSFPLSEPATTFQKKDISCLETQASALERSSFKGQRQRHASDDCFLKRSVFRSCIVQYIPFRYQSRRQLFKKRHVVSRGSSVSVRALLLHKRERQRQQATNVLKNECFSSCIGQDILSIVRAVDNFQKKTCRSRGSKLEP